MLTSLLEDLVVLARFGSLGGVVATSIGNLPFFLVATNFVAEWAETSFRNHESVHPSGA